MDSDLSKCKVGDYIWTIRDGWIGVGKIVCSSHYPIFAGKSTYTLEGKEYRLSAAPSAFVVPPTEFNVGSCRLTRK